MAGKRHVSRLHTAHRARGWAVDVKIDDRMYRVSENVVINESKMLKFGLGVGEILLTIIRHPDIEVDCPRYSTRNSLPLFRTRPRRVLF